MSGFDDKELFENALSDAAPTEQTAVERPNGEADTSQQRDERGRYAAVQPEAIEPSQEQATEPNEQPQDQGEQPVPGKRFGEVTRARDEAVRRAEEAERRAQEYEARIRALEGQRQPAQPQPSASERPDPVAMLLENPEAFLAQRDSQMLSAIGEQLARSTPEKAKAYDEAFSALANLRQQNHAAFQSAYVSIMSNNPLSQHQALVDWHRDYQTQQRVGNDPDAFFARTLEERLSKDPEFAKSLVEKLTGQARQAATANGDKPLLNLPPSLSRATAAAPNAGAGLTDLSDAAIFADALRN